MDSIFKKMRMLIFFSFFSYSIIGLALPHNTRDRRVCIESNAARKMASFKLPVIDGCFSNWNCTKDGANALCTALGKGSDEIPLLYISRNGGNDWKKIKIPGLDTNWVFGESSCGSNKTDAICVLTARNNITWANSLYQSNDAGKTWSLQDVAHGEKWWVLETVSCEQDTCVVGGNINGQVLLIMQTVDKGKTWVRVSHIAGDLPPESFFHSACTSVADIYPNIICYLQGYAIFDPKTGENGAYYAYTVNNGQKWHGGYGTGD